MKHKFFNDLTVVPTTWHGATLAEGPRHPVPGMSPDNCTDQLGVAGPWNERLPHFRAGFQPSSGDEIQSEFFALWLSPTSGRQTVAIHFTFTLDALAVAAAVAAIERALEPFAPRPHWGKVFGLDPAVVAATYPRFTDFTGLVSEVDPKGKLRNDFLDQLLLLSR